MTTEISDFERRVQDRIAQRDAPGATVSVRREFSPGDSLLAEAGYDFADGDRLLAQAEAERRQAEHAPAPARMTDAMIQRTIDSRVAAAVDVFRAEVQQAINELSDMIAETLDEIEHEVADAIRTLAERVTDLEIIGKAQRADNVTALPIVRKNSDDAA